VAEDALARIRAEADAEIARAVAAAGAADWPEVAEAYRDVQDVGTGRWF
jgi:TPP-dependent pyruvate/acetoin dehydrogenase alpha subunit